MEALLLARVQFALTSIFRFFFVPLTLGLSIFVAIMETAYVRTGNEMFKRLTKFWGNIFLINFANDLFMEQLFYFQRPRTCLSCFSSKKQCYRLGICHDRYRDSLFNRHYFSRTVPGGYGIKPQPGMDTGNL